MWQDDAALASAIVSHHFSLSHLSSERLNRTMVLLCCVEQDGLLPLCVCCVSCVASERTITTRSIRCISRQQLSPVCSARVALHQPTNQPTNSLHLGPRSHPSALHSRSDCGSHSSRVCPQQQCTAALSLHSTVLLCATLPHLFPLSHCKLTVERHDGHVKDYGRSGWQRSTPLSSSTCAPTHLGWHCARLSSVVCVRVWAVRCAVWRRV